MTGAGGRQGRINHCAGCTMGGGPRRQGPPRSTAKFLPRCLNVQKPHVSCRLKRLKRSSTFGGGGKKSAPSERKKSWLRIREKGPHVMLVWGPRMVNPALVVGHTDRLTNR